MACRFEVTLSDEDAVHVDAARAALDEVDRLEAVLTVFKETSEVSRLNNAAADGPVPAGPWVLEVLRLSRELHAATGGAFDVTSTPLSRCWGFLRRQGRLPSPDELAQALARVGMDKVLVDEEHGSVRFTRPGVELNFGSIGKGYALDRVGALLRERGVERALLSAAGSSVLAMGGGPDGWRVDVRSARSRRGRLARLRLRDAALATSGTAEQFFEVEGRRYGHVLDPRTGWPAAGALSVSVVASDAATADALSTAFFVGGTRLAESYCASHPATLALVTPEDEAAGPLVFGAHPGALVEVEQ